MPAPAGMYYLSDGRSWQTGAGIFYTPNVSYTSTTVSNGYIFYYFTPLDNGVLYQQSDTDGANYSRGTLGWAGDIVVLSAAIGSTEATFSGYTTILDNSIPANLDPHYEVNYFSAPVGESVYFQMSYSIWNPDGSTWQPDTFENSFDYKAGGYVNFTQVVPEPNASVLIKLGTGFILLHGFWKIAAKRVRRTTIVGFVSWFLRC